MDDREEKEEVGAEIERKIGKHSGNLTTERKFTEGLAGQGKRLGRI